MHRRRVAIMGAAGRDFHDFNVCFRDDPTTTVVAFTAAQIRANRFTLTLRAMSAEAVPRAESALREVADAGLPNYFDDQRFGSVGGGEEFIAREMVFGRFERALWLALAAPYEFDRADAKREKATLTALWGKWPECQAKLPKGHARSLVSYLAAHPTFLQLEDRQCGFTVQFVLMPYPTPDRKSVV